ncbi:MAG: alpha/beta hydrolase [Phycisphaerales bacterium]
MVSALALSACGVSPEKIMATPVIYVDGRVEPFADLPPERRTPELDVFFATNRELFDDDEDVWYTDVESERLHLGSASMRLGDDSITWEELYKVSTSASCPKPPTIRLMGARELAGTPLLAPGPNVDPAPPQETAAFLAAVNKALAESSQNEIVIYIHGAKVDFYNACAFTAEIQHFLGRGFVPIAFSWPTHDHIFAYLLGEDVRRASDSTGALSALLDLLADGTSASRINIVCWSAGGRVTSQALAEIAEAAGPGARERYRLGAVVFEMPDVELGLFLDRLPAIASIAERPVITVTDDDEALDVAEIFMGGGPRAGKQGHASDDEQALLESLPNVEIVDVSHGKEERGFNITGHRCWFMHPWGVTDLIMLLRFDLPASERGLVETDLWGVWAMPVDYPQRAGAAAAARVQRDRAGGTERDSAR